MRTDSLLGHCVARAAALSGDASPWSIVKAAHKGGRVAAFITEWALMQDELERDDLSVEDYITWSHVPRRTCYLRSAEYRELWPDTPVNELAAAVGTILRGRETRSPASIPLAV